MTVDERMLDFIASFDRDEAGILLEIEREAEQHDVPIIRRSERSLLRVLLTVKKPERILEVGTAIGFSAVLMADCVKDAHIDTIENWPPRIEQAGINIQRSGFAGRIKLLEGDACEIIKQL